MQGIFVTQCPKANLSGGRKSVVYPLILNQKTSVIPFQKAESMAIMANEKIFHFYGQFLCSSIFPVVRFKVATLQILLLGDLRKGAPNPIIYQSRWRLSSDLIEMVNRNFCSWLHFENFHFRQSVKVLLIPFYTQEGPIFDSKSFEIQIYTVL